MIRAMKYLIVTPSATFRGTELNMSHSVASKTIEVLPQLYHGNVLTFTVEHAVLNVANTLAPGLTKNGNMIGSRATVFGDFTVVQLAEDSEPGDLNTGS